MLAHDADEAQDIDNFIYRKADLLKIIRKNRDAHKKTAAKAKVKHRALLIRTCAQSLARAKAGKSVAAHHFLEDPKEFTKDYDRAIRMLELTTLTHVKLEGTQFKQLVMDEWPWSGQFATTVNYSNAKVGRR